MTIPSILNYQGNKSSLIPFLKKNIEKYLEPGEIFFPDIFFQGLEVLVQVSNKKI